ncbi:MAG: four helix bundle protein [Candidatus Angelobacter sp.]
MKDFRDLKVWEKAHELPLDCYSLTANFPKHEIFGLVSQIRRAGSSIGANIAEGCGRGGNGEFQRFLQMAMGSASELEYHWLLAKDLQFIDIATHNDIHPKVVEVKKMLTSLIRKIDAKRRA